MTSNEKLIEQAKAGNTAPLLAALKDAPMSGPPAGSPTADMDMPKNTLYLEVEAAVGNGELPESILDPDNDGDNDFDPADDTDNDD